MRQSGRALPAEETRDDGKFAIDHEWIEARDGKPGVTMTLLWSEYCVKATDHGADPSCTRLSASAIANGRSGTASPCISTVARPRRCRSIGLASARRIATRTPARSARPTCSWLPAVLLDDLLALSKHGRGVLDRWAHRLPASSAARRPSSCRTTAKTGVIKNTVEELVVTSSTGSCASTTAWLSCRHGFAGQRTKAAVEMSVGVVETKVIAACATECSSASRNSLRQSTRPWIPSTPRPSSSGPAAGAGAFLGRGEECLQAPAADPLRDDLGQEDRHRPV